ncbi:MAG: cytochrome c biogenesis protein CcsA [Planctomycetota bacterium]
MKSLRCVAGWLLSTALVCSAVTAGASDPPRARSAAWDPAVVAQFAALPVQEEGRVKPLNTAAKWMLVRQNGLSSCKTPSGERLSAMEWLLDSWFYPEQARTYETISVTDSVVLDAIGLSSIVKKKRARYSYAELEPGLTRLRELAMQYSEIERDDLSTTQGQTLDLWRSMHESRMLQNGLHFARARFPMGNSKGLSRTFPGRDEVRFSEILDKVGALGAVYEQLRRGTPDGVSDADAEAERQALETVLLEFNSVASAGGGFAMLAPDRSIEGDSAWFTIEEVAFAAASGRDVPPGWVAAIAAFEEMAASEPSAPGFAVALGKAHDELRGLATARGEGQRLDLEVSFYKWAPMQWSLGLFVLGFLFVALSWLGPGARLLRKITWSTVLLALGMLIAGIAMRCIIRNRPPMTGIYDTIPFITAVGTLAALVIEWINRRRVALPVAAFLGMAGMFLAYRYELGDANDNMKRVVAVLDTNFWLWIHVTCIATGYAAGLLAGAIAHIYVLGKLFGLRRGDKAFYSGIARMVYGAICFCLIFAVVGTILGGVWANESWGRFWGWDPKENGALLICLWNIAILHARMGGYIRHLGLCVAAILGNAVVAWSWWGVNMMGIGLHSYGFTDGAVWLYLGYGVEGVMALLGGVVWLLERERSRMTPPAAPANP